jgi:hypothetical protein
MKSRRMRWTRYLVRMGDSRCAYRVLVVKPEGRILLGRPKRRWKNNIKVYVREVGQGDGLNRSDSG